MAIIECFLRKDNTRLGFIQIRNSEPYYGYGVHNCTHMPLENAIKLVNKLSNTYLFKIHRDKTDTKKEQPHYIIVD